MAQKSIVEQALLQVQTLEEAVKANAKGILASVMKQELNDLLKEQEDEKDPEEDEKDVTDAPVDDESPISPEDSEDAGENLPAVDDETPEEGEESDDVLDMTDASEEEVLKVFKAMKPEDGIIVKKDGNTVSFEDDGNEYIIKLDDEAESPEEGEGNEELPDELPDELAEQTSEEPAGSEEIVYEIELDDEDEEAHEFEAKEEVSLTDGKPFDKKAKKTETKESVTVHKSHTTKDGQPFDKSSPQTGVKKLEAKEQATIGGAERPGNAPAGTKNPKVVEPGKGGTKTTQAEPFGDTALKGTKPAEKKEPGKGTGSAKQVESKPGTPPKGTGKPELKDPGKDQQDKKQAPEAKEEVKEGECTECGNKTMKETEATEAVRTKWNAHGKRAEESRTGLPSKKVHYSGSQTIHTASELAEQVNTLKAQNDEYKKALVLFKDKLNEVAVFNANLAYATRLFTEHSTTKQEKLDILKRFDTISTITESKNLYTTIKGELETKKPISEAAVEKITSTPSSSATEMLSESKAYENPQFKRMKELMTKIK